MIMAKTHYLLKILCLKVQPYFFKFRLLWQPRLNLICCPDSYVCTIPGADTGMPPPLGRTVKFFGGGQTNVAPLIQILCEIYHLIS